MEQNTSNGNEAGISITAPFDPSKRHEIIDIIRGFALFGVLAANLTWTFQWLIEDSTPSEMLTWSVWDEITNILMGQFFNAKSYTLFSMLFGLGFAMQLQRAASRGGAITGLYIRRMIILFVLGVAHAVLLWFGDILHVYALLGLVLLVFRRASNRTLIILMLGAWLGVLSLATAQRVANWSPPESVPAATSEKIALDSPMALDERSQAEGELLAYPTLSSSSYPSIVEYNWQKQVEDYTDFSADPDSMVGWYLSVFWKFLFGFMIGRACLLQRASEHLHLFSRVLKWSLPVGMVGVGAVTVPAVVLQVWPIEEPGPMSLLWFTWEIGNIGMTVSYVCIMAIWFQTPLGKRVLSPLAPVGRMALTNYLAHSVCFMLIFYGLGFGLIGKTSHAGLFFWAIGIFGAQIVLSSFWLRFFRFGPMEWLWRCLTYGKLQPMRAK